MSTPPNYEVPTEMRDFAEKSVDQARKAFDSFVRSQFAAIQAQAKEFSGIAQSAMQQGAERAKSAMQQGADEARKAMEQGQDAAKQGAHDAKDAIERSTH